MVLLWCFGYGCTDPISVSVSVLILKAILDQVLVTVGSIHEQMYSV